MCAGADGIAVAASSDCCFKQPVEVATNLCDLFGRIRTEATHETIAVVVFDLLLIECASPHCICWVKCEIAFETAKLVRFGNHAEVSAGCHEKAPEKSAVCIWRGEFRENECSRQKQANSATVNYQ
jgi:hypothetical protein